MVYFISSTFLNFAKTPLQLVNEMQASLRFHKKYSIIEISY